MRTRLEHGEIVLRGLAIGAMTAVCAVASLIVGMAVFHTILPETDAAKDALFFGLLDPFVMTLAVPVAGLAGIVAYPFAFFLLLRTRLEKSIPAVLAATVVGTALGAVAHIFVAMVTGLGIGICAMIVCNRVLRERPARLRPI